MFENFDRYFALIVPLCVLLLATALVGCWGVLRPQRQRGYLLWMAAGYALSAIGLGWQSLLDNAELARWATVTGAMYLGGAWALARAMACRYGHSAHLRTALLIAALVLAALFYYGELQPNLLARMHWLNAGLGLLQILPMRGILRNTPPRDGLERTLRCSYLAFACYTMVRPLLIMLFLPELHGNELPRSGYWLITLAGTLLFSLWFTMMLLASTAREVFSALHEERSRDPLTQLLNRRAFMEAANSVLNDRRTGPWAVVVGDLDHFKLVNDNWGHASGDLVLQSFSALLQQQVRAGDLVARFGGEEFVLLLQRANLFEAEQVAQRIGAQLRAIRLACLPSDHQLTVSFGIAAVSSPAGLDVALSRADVLLYLAKQGGRNRVHVDQEAMALEHQPS